jgi:leucyl aminopeptidase (aminopeptidase T)
VSQSLSAKTMTALARSVLQKNLLLRRGENLTVESWTDTLPLANAFVMEGFALQLRPMLLYVDEETIWEAVRRLPASNLGRVGSHEWAALRQTNGYVFLWGPADTVREEALSPEKLRAITAYDNEWFRIVEKAGVRSVRLALGRINATEARRYAIDVDAWRQEAVDATLVDPSTMKRSGGSVARRLLHGRSIRITHPNGTALQLRLKGRRPRVHDGVIDAADVHRGDVVEPLPSGWVSVALDEQFAEGEFVANVTSSASASGMDAGGASPGKGGRWTFKAGKLTRFAYSSGGEEFAKIYNRLGPGKERPGGLSIGLNPRIQSLPNMEDQRLGRVTLQIGRNTYLDGVTHSPNFHGYLCLDGADLQIDDRSVVRGGELV